MKQYNRVMLGKGSIYAQDCFSGNFIGANYGITQDLTDHLPDDWRAFNREFIPIFLANRPEKSKVAAGLACGMLWTLAKGLNVGDMVLSPDGSGTYHVGEIVGEYFYQPDEILPHRRSVRWLTNTISRAAMSDDLRHSAGSTGVMCDLTKHSNEIETLLGSIVEPAIIARDSEVEDPYVFALEKHLEDFLVQNWSHTEFGRDYDIFKEENELVGQQYLTDTGPIDILAISRDKQTLLVVELKKGRGSDVVVGQILRYMGYVKDELAEPNQTVKGVIIAMEDDQRMRRAMSIVPNIDFYRYKVSFKLIKD